MWHRTRGVASVVSSWTAQGWRFQYRTTVKQSDGTKKPVAKGGFATPRAATQALRKLQVTSDEGKYADPGKYTAGSWLAEWLDSNVELAAKPARKEFYANLIRLYLAEIKDKPLGELTSTCIGQLMVRLLKRGKQNGKGLAPGTARLVYGILSQALDAAVNREPALLAANPAKKNPKTTKPQALRTRSVEWWDAEQLGIFLGWARKQCHYEDVVLWTVVAATGLRKAEALSLQWRHIHLDSGSIAVQYGKAAHDGEPRKRNVPLGPNAAEVLREYKAKRNVMGGKLLAGPGAFVFGNDNGDPLRPHATATMFTRAVIRCRRDLGLTDGELRPLHGIHGLRHTAASIMIADRLPLPYVASVLGHTIDVLTDVYAHVIPPANGFGTGVLDAAVAIRPGQNDLGIDLALAGQPDGSGTADQGI
jgi:integrase